MSKQESSETETVVEQFVCPGCALLCDDVAVVLSPSRQVKTVHNACARGLVKIREIARADRLTEPHVRDASSERAVSYTEAIDETARVLREAQNPMLYGWSSNSCEAQLAGLQLAAKLRGHFDGTASICQGHYSSSLKAVGGATCTIGDVVNKADLVIFWGANPAEAHPRHMGRTLFTRGMFRISGKEMRRSVTVDVVDTATAHANDLFLKITPGTDFEIFQALRAHLELKHPLPEMLGGVPRKDWLEFLQYIGNAEFPVIFAGLGVTASPGTFHNLDALNQFIAALKRNQQVQAYAVSMAGHYNMVGLTTVLTAQTGFPFGLDYTRGTPPRWNPGETTFVDLLARDQLDTVVVVASDPMVHLPHALARKLQTLNLVVLDYQETLTTRAADLVIPVQISGLETGGTAYRLDGVPLPLKPLAPGPEGIQSDRDVLSAILAALE